LLRQLEQVPPVLRGVKDTDDPHATLERQLEDQMPVKAFDPPLAYACQRQVLSHYG